MVLYTWPSKGLYGWSITSCILFRWHFSNIAFICISISEIPEWHKLILPLGLLVWQFLPGGYLVIQGVLHIELPRGHHIYSCTFGVLQRLWLHDCHDQCLTTHYGISLHIVTYYHVVIITKWLTIGLQDCLTALMGGCCVWNRYNTHCLVTLFKLQSEVALVNL